MSQDKKTADSAPQQVKKTSIIVQAGIFLLVTAVASGAGFGASIFLKPNIQTANHEKAPVSQTTNEEEEAGQNENKDAGDEEAALSGYAKPLAPILTNLAAPSDVWVRLEAAVVATGELEEATLEEVHQDLLAYMRTVKLHHVEGPSGFLNLSAELSDRASIRTNGVVSRVLIRTILFE